MSRACRVHFLNEIACSRLVFWYHARLCGACHKAGRANEMRCWQLWESPVAASDMLKAFDNEK